MTHHDDLENQVSAAFQQIREGIAPSPFPHHFIPAANSAPVASGSCRTRQVRRVGMIVGIGLAMSGAGLGAAAAVGVKMPTFWWGEATPGAFNAVPGTERLTATTMDGPRAQLWIAEAIADTGDKGYCAVFVLPDEPSSNNSPGGGCAATTSDKDWSQFGVSGVGSGDLFAAHVPGAATVTLIQADGSPQQLSVVDDWTIGRVTAPDTKAVVVVGYNARGQEIGRTAPGALRSAR